MQMKNMLTQYEESIRLVRDRIAFLRMQMKESGRSPMEQQMLESRRRLLSEEAHEMEQSREKILLYVEAWKIKETEAKSQL